MTTSFSLFIFNPSSQINNYLQYVSLFSFRKLQRLSKWMHIQAKNHNDIPKPLMTVDWLPLSLFDPNLHFVLGVADNSFCLDVSIHGGEMTVKQISDDRGYQRVCFRSALEFEQFVKFHIQRNILP